MILWKYIYNYKPIDIRAFLRINIRIQILLEQLLRCYTFFNYKHTNNTARIRLKVLLLFLYLIVKKLLL